MGRHRVVDRTPLDRSDDATRDEDSRRSKLARKVVEKVVGLKRSIHDEAGELHNLLVGVTSLQITNKEGMGAWDCDLVLERLQDLLVDPSYLGSKRHDAVTYESNLGNN